jgi:hypothetical protein
MDWDPFPVISCLIGIGLMVLAGRIRRRSLDRRTQDVLRRNEVLKRSARHPASSKDRMAPVIRLRKRTAGPRAPAKPRRSNVYALPRR